jgi:GNAT superfamily N-acetyltransferase
MNASVAAGLAREIAKPTLGCTILAAVDPTGIPLGFVSLRTGRDYFTEVPVGHVVDLVVAREGEGRGVGRALLAAAERWAERAGYPWLTLHEFEGNDRARRVYEQMGYVVEWTRILKPVGARRTERN